MGRSFPPVPMVWVNPDGTLTADARRFMQSIFTQLGGTDPVDFETWMTQQDQMLFSVLALP